METIEGLNKKINKLFRQLGRDVYVNSKAGRLRTSEIDKMVRKIDQFIKTIEVLKSEQSFQEEVKIILTPEINEEGLGVYFFCEKCRVGNNPASTHCIKCGAALNS